MLTDYKGFEAAITADYDAQSAVERELVLRLASLLWRLRRATTIETGLFEIQADHLSNFRKTHQISPASREIVYAVFNANSDRQIASRDFADATETSPASRLALAEGEVAPDVELARCFLRLCNLPNYALDRLSRYEATPLASGRADSLCARQFGSPQATGENAAFRSWQ